MDERVEPVKSVCIDFPLLGPDGWRCPVGSYGGYLEGEEFGRPTHWLPLPEPPTQDT